MATKNNGNGGEILNINTGLILLCSISLTVSIVILNKIILSTLDFPYPITLTACHFLTNSVFTQVMGFLGIFKMKSIPLQPIVKLALLNASSMALVNYSLQVNSVAVYQTFKLLNIPLSAFIYAVFLGRNNLNSKIIVSLITICVGVSCVITSSSISSTISTTEMVNSNYSLWNLISHFNISTTNCFGLVIGFASSFAIIGSQIYGGEVMKEYDLSGVEIFHLYNLPQSIFALFMSIYYENNAFFKLKDRIFTYNNNGIELKLPSYLLSTCLIALGINIVTPVIVKRTSSTTYQVAGIIKTSLIIIIGYVFFHRHNDYQNFLFKMYLEFAGIAISMFGVSLYFVFKTKKQEEDKKKS